MKLQAKARLLASQSENATRDFIKMAAEEMGLGKFDVGAVLDLVDDARFYAALKKFGFDMENYADFLETYATKDSAVADMREALMSYD